MPKQSLYRGQKLEDGNPLIVAYGYAQVVVGQLKLLVWDVSCFFLPQRRII